MEAKNRRQPTVEVKDKAISQIGIVVADAVKTAKRYSEIFGVGPWYFIDVTPRDFILHGETYRNAETGLRLALANMGKMQIELIEPQYGQSTHMSFLQEKGEGIHHVSFGVVKDHDQIVTNLAEQGVGIEMQGLSGDTGTFTYLATQEKLGTIYEVVNPITSGAGGGMKPWGAYRAQGDGAVNIEGKEIKQLGIVVDDVEKIARNYWELMGIGPWYLLDLTPQHLADAYLHGIAIDETQVHIKAGIAQFGGIQLELLQPVQGPSTHMEFLRTRGQGIHHVSFDQIDDHDRVISGFESMGIEVESSGLLGGAITFTYLATQKDLGTIFEAVKVHPGKTNTLTAYEIYPPNK